MGGLSFYRRLIDEQVPIVLYTTHGTWYAGTVLDRTGDRLTLEVKTYKEWGMANPYKVFSLDEIDCFQEYTAQEAD